MSALTDLINAYIRRNANQEITGPILNGVLLALAASAENVPYIGENGDWYLYDTETGQYADSGHSSTLFRDVAVDITEDGGDPSGSAVVSGTTLLLTLANIRGEQGPEGPEGPAGPAGVTRAEADVDFDGGDVSVDVSLLNGLLSFMFKNIIGPEGPAGPSGPAGSDAGFGRPTASVDANTGTPSVEISASGPSFAKVFDFAFHNLKGETGETGATGPTGPEGSPGITDAAVTVDANIGTPSVEASIVNKVLTLAFHNLKGETGATGQTGQTGPQGPTGPAGPAGVTSAAATVDSNVGTPGVSVSLSNGVLTFTFTNLKGETGATGATGQTGQTGPQGDPGDSCAVPVGTAIPSGGLKANNHYTLGTLTGSVVVTLDTTTEVAGQMNIYSMAFTAGSTAPTITWPGSITKWAGNCLDSNNAPVITAGNSYEVSIVDGLAVITEFTS